MSLIALSLIALMLVVSECRGADTIDILAGANLGLAVVDVTQTVRCLRAETCREINPFLARMQNHPTALAAVSLGARAGSIYAIRWMGKRNRKTSIIGLVALAGVQTAVVIHNAREMRR